MSKNLNVVKTQIWSLHPSEERVLNRRSIRLMITSRLSTGFDAAAAFAAASAAAAADLSSSWSDVGDVGE